MNKESEQQDLFIEFDQYFFFGSQRSKQRKSQNKFFSKSLTLMELESLLTPANFCGFTRTVLSVPPDNII